MRKILALATLMLCLMAVPTFAAPSSPSDISDNGGGAKQLTPLLDLVGREMEKLGIKIMDNAVYCMERLWKDTVNFNFTKSKI